MAKCETCGNEYDQSFEVIMDGERHVFDCFECAIQLLAPACAHCGCAVIGHGVEDGGRIFCCHHCVRRQDEYNEPVAANLAAGGDINETREENSSGI